MERLLSDAEKLTGVHYDISNLSDVYNAIHAIQVNLDVSGYSTDQLNDKLKNMSLTQDELKKVATDMGISYEEAFNKMQNGTLSVRDAQVLLGTTAKEASTTIQGSFASMKASFTNFLSGAGSIDEVIKTVEVFGENVSNALIKIAPDIINGLVQLINNLIPQIPNLLDKLLPTLMKGIIDLVKGLVGAIPQILSVLSSMLPSIITSLINGLTTIITEMSNQLPQIIPMLVDAITNGILSILDNIDLLIDAGIQLIIGLTEGLINAIPILIEKVPIIIDKLITKLTDPEMIGKIWNASARLVTELAIGLIKAIPSLLRGVNQIRESIKKNLYNLVSNMGDIGKNLVKGIWTGIINSSGWLKSKISGWVGNVTNFIRKMFKIGSPSKLMEDEVGQWLPKGIAIGIDANTDSVTDAMNDMYKEMNRTIKMENSKMNFDVISGDVYNKSFFQTPVAINVQADVEMDSQKVGRLVTPSVTRTIKNGGGI